jgi:hypothetical protein
MEVTPHGFVPVMHPVPLCRAVQTNVAAASARVLVHCSVCFLLTTMVALGDAALVAGLHAGAGLPLSVSFGIAVGANLALVLLLFVVLLLVRCLNRSSDRAMSQALTGPQVRSVLSSTAHEQMPRALLLTGHVMSTAAGCSARYVRCGVHAASCVWQLGARPALMGDVTCSCSTLAVAL